jgi:peptidylprolyl isomerase
MNKEIKKIAEIGDTVRVHYTGKTNGEVFDTSLEREPFEFTLGRQEVIGGFEKAVLGLAIDEEVTTETIAPEDGYGIHIPQMVQEILEANLPDGYEIGSVIQGTGAMGEPVIATVTEVVENTTYTSTTGEVVENTTVAKVDFNHQLAGKELIFDIKLLEIIEAEKSDEE